ncbi:MAG: hypothetical protein ACRYF3_15020 [Janthinobacterium lividum]
MAPPAADPSVLTKTLTIAVDAAHAEQLRAFGDGVDALARFDADQFRSILGWVLHGALEELHPDGLDADDLRDVVSRIATRTSGWWPEVNPQVLVVVLTGAFGEHPEPEDVPRLPHDVVVAHSVLVLDDLVAATGRPLARHLVPALAEVRRAETMEMP